METVNVILKKHDAWDSTSNKQCKHFQKNWKHYLWNSARLASRHFWDKKWSPLRTKALQKLQTKAEETEKRGFQEQMHNFHIISLCKKTAYLSDIFSTTKNISNDNLKKQRESDYILWIVYLRLEAAFSQIGALPLSLGIQTWYLSPQPPQAPTLSKIS